MVRLVALTLDGLYETPRILGELTCAAKYGGRIRLRRLFNDGAPIGILPAVCRCGKDGIAKPPEDRRSPGFPHSAWRFTAVRFF